MRTIENNALYNGYKICRNAPSVSHLMFAGYLILFGTLDEKTVDTLQHILGTYASWSGQYANMQKSSIHFSKGVKPNRRTEIANILGVQQMQINDKYLGHQLLKSSYKIDSYDFLDDKFDAKLAGWKRTHFSHAGRSIMIKHVLGLIPPYYMETSLILKKVLQRLTRTMRNFWWGHSREVSKAHYINWKRFEQSKDAGGLGVRNLQHINRAMIAKLIWKLLENDSCLWCQLMRAKYLHKESFWEVKKAQKGSSTWSAMLNCISDMKDGCCWVVKDGKKINIKEDPWVPNLHNKKPNPISISSNCPTHVSELILHDPVRWDAGKIQQLFTPYEAEKIMDIYITENQNEDSEDKLLWIHHPNGKFSTKSFLKSLQDRIPTSSSAGNNEDFPWKKFWQVKVPSPKILLFLWRLLKNGIAVGSRLSKFWKEVNADCRLCNGATETLEHLFLYCPVSQNFLFASPLELRTDERLNLSVSYHVKNWLLEGDLSKFKLGSCLLWVIWKTRNDVFFNNGKIQLEKMLQETAYWYSQNNPDVDSLTLPTEQDLLDSAAVVWSPPPQPKMKINFDGAAGPRGYAGAAVARNSQLGVDGCQAKVHVTSGG